MMLLRTECFGYWDKLQNAEKGYCTHGTSYVGDHLAEANYLTLFIYGLKWRCTKGWQARRYFLAYAERHLFTVSAQQIAEQNANDDG